MSDEKECHHNRITEWCYICNPAKPFEIVTDEPDPAIPRPEFDLDNLFTHHPPFGDQVKRYHVIRTAGKDLASVILAHVPASPERSTAIAKIREAIM